MRTLKRDQLAEVHFENALVPDDALLGAAGGGFPVLGAALDLGRFSVAARCVRQAPRCLELAPPYAPQPRAFGQPLGEFPLIQQKLARLTRRTHAAHAGLFLVVASVDRAKQHKGVSAFLVDPAATRGIRIGAFPMRTLKRDQLAEVHFENALVPDDALLGEAGGGFPVLGAALDLGRFSVAARCVGQAQRCLDLALPYAQQRRAFGQPIGEFQLIQQKLADMTCRTQAARNAVYQLGRMKDAGIPRASMESSIAKLMASQAAVQNALDAMQIHGGYGLSEEYEVGRLLLEAKSLEFGEGTSELHTKLIAEFMLGMRKQ